MTERFLVVLVVIVAVITCFAAFTAGSYYYKIRNYDHCEVCISYGNSCFRSSYKIMGDYPYGEGNMSAYPYGEGS